MKPKVLFLSILFFLLMPIKGYSVDCDQDCQKTLIEEYFTNLAKVYQQDSREADVNRLFELFDQNVKYEHLEYGANFERNEWITAFKNNQRRGAYSAGPKDSIRVENYIFGKSHVAVEYSYGEITNSGEWLPKGDQKLFALFGFNGSKIVLVREYW